MSTDVKIGSLEPTPLDDIPKAVADLWDSFRTTKTKDVEWRLVQLRKLWWGLQDLKPKIQAALKKDLNKSPHDSTFSEINFNEQDVTHIIKNLKSWAKDEKADYPLTFAPTRPRIRKEPLGPVLIIGTYNFPFMLNFGPLIGAIAAGCPAIVKPSEHAPATSVVFKELVETYLDPSAYKVVQGAVPETTVLLEQKWGKIMYTGSSAVARIVSRKAAETLTPVALELGGLNPAFVTPSADMALAARRLLWGKTINAGQVCMAHQYVLVERSRVDDFIKHTIAASRDFFPQGARECPDYCRIVNERHFDRMKHMLDTTSGKIVIGGETDRDRLFIAPTAVLVDSPDDIMVREESFGPIWAILPYDNLDDAIKVANDVDSTPLSLMSFGSSSENEKSGSSFLPSPPPLPAFRLVPLTCPLTNATNAQLTKHPPSTNSPHARDFRRRDAERLVYARGDADVTVRRGGQLRDGGVPRAGGLRLLHAPAHLGGDPRLDGRLPARALLPVRGGRAPAVRAPHPVAARLRPRRPPPPRPALLARPRPRPRPRRRRQRCVAPLDPRPRLRVRGPRRRQGPRPRRPRPHPARPPDQPQDRAPGLVPGRSSGGRAFFPPSFGDWTGRGCILDSPYLNMYTRDYD